MSRSATVKVGTIGDAAARFGLDFAGVWDAITWGRELRNPDGKRVVLVADKSKREGTTWVVEERDA